MDRDRLKIKGGRGLHTEEAEGKRHKVTGGTVKLEGRGQSWRLQTLWGWARTRLYSTHLKALSFYPGDKGEGDITEGF